MNLENSHSPWQVYEYYVRRAKHLPRDLSMERAQKVGDMLDFHSMDSDSIYDYIVENRSMIEDKLKTARGNFFLKLHYAEHLKLVQAILDVVEFLEEDKVIITDTNE